MSKKPYKAEGWENIVVNNADGNTLCLFPGGTLEEAKANAALFAAAPDLLDALVDALEVIGSWGEDGDPAWAERAKETIRKATNA